MTHIAPLPDEAIADPELRGLMAEAEALGVPDPLFARIAARAPQQAKPFMRALIMSHRDGNVDRDEHADQDLYANGDTDRIAARWHTRSLLRH